MILEILLMIIGFIVLIKSADILVDGASNIAKKINISEITIGLTIVAIGTSAPELAVSIKSAISGHPDIVIGNILGSNMGNLFLILGICSIISPIRINKQTKNIEIPMLIFVNAMLFIICINGNSNFEKNINKQEGIILIIGFLIFLIYNFLILKREKNNLEKQQVLHDKKITFLKSIIYIILGIIGLKYGGDFVVNSSIEIAKKLEVSDKIISLTIISLGTNLPELVTCIIASVKKQSGILVGNIIGSQILNITLILGIVAIILPIKYSTEYMLEIIILNIGTIVFSLLPYVGKRGEITRNKGLLFIVMYVIYLVYLVSSNI